MVFSTIVSSAATGSINATDVKFREGPGTSTNVLDILSKNTLLELIDEQDQWCQVKIGGITGYVYADYVSINTTEIPSVTAETTSNVIKDAEPVMTTPAAIAIKAAIPEVNPDIRFITANSLNLRAADSSDSEKLGEVVRGDEVVLLANDTEYAKIKTAKGVIGFVLSKYLSADQTISRGIEDKAEQIVNYALSLKGIRYVYGGASTKGFDCSGFTMYVFKHFGIKTPRSSYEYGGAGVKISRENLRVGDCVLFDTDGSKKTNISHVGIYIGNDKFVHASTSHRKVVVQSLSGYNAKYLGARRFIR